MKNDILTAKAAANGAGHRVDIAAAAAAVMRLYHLCVKQDWFYALDYGCGLVGALDLLLIRAIRNKLRTEDTRAAVTAEQNAPLIKNSQAIEQTRAAYGGAGLYGNAIEETYIYREEAAIIRAAKSLHTALKMKHPLCIRTKKSTHSTKLDIAFESFMI